jgi:protein phosphatase
VDGQAKKFNIRTNKMHDPEITQPMKNDTEKNPGISWTSSGRTETGCVRKHNEDAVLERPDLFLWVVADGMGGYDAGDVASRMIVESLNDIPPTDKLSKRVDDIEDRILAVHDQLMDMGQKNGITAGSTVLVLQGHVRHCLVLWAGDSRAYLFRENTLTHFSRDHSYVDEMVARGEIRLQDSHNHSQANVITRAVGASDPLILDLDMMEVQDGDIFLMCSDGLNKEVSDEEIQKVMALGDEHQITSKLMELALERGARDNVTVQAVRYRINE